MQNNEYQNSTQPENEPQSGSYGAKYQGQTPPSIPPQNNGNGYPYGSPYEKAPKKPKTVPLYAVIAIVLITAVVTFQATSIGYMLLNSGDDGIPSYFDSALTIDEYLRTYYIGELDEELLSQALAAALLYASGDAYAYYYTPEDYMQESMSYEGNAVGIGVLVTYREDGYIEILRVFNDGPASKAGIKKGDIIIAVNGEDIAEMGYENSVKAIQGEIGTEVSLTVKRGEETLTLTATRAEYVQQTVDGHIYKDGTTEKKIGVVQIYSFNNSTTEQFKTKVTELIEAGAEGLIFDVRDNPGGTLNSVVKMLDFLLPEGKIVRIIDKNGKEVQSYSSDKNCIDLPMAVLTNENTASAAELFTSALKDYNKAISVGTKSYGKGTMQIMIPLPDGGAFKFSYRFYSPPFSDNYNGIGISPEIELPLTEGANINYLTDENDNQLAAAAEYIISGTLPTN